MEAANAPVAAVVDMDKTQVEIGGKVIKEVAVNELKKHKVSAIMGFVKNGNLQMVHGLIRYH